MREKLTAAEKWDRKANAIETLRRVLKPGDTVSCVLTKRSSSGMYRHIKVLASIEGRVSDISNWVSDATGMRWHDEGAVGVGGCGMDMGFQVVYSLSHVLFPDGFVCAGKDTCPSNDHVNGDGDYSPHQHKSGGYALGHRWI